MRVAASKKKPAKAKLFMIDLTLGLLFLPVFVCVATLASLTALGEHIRKMASPK